MSLARPSLVAFCQGGVWRAARGQLIVCLDIRITRDDGLFFLCREWSSALLTRYLAHLVCQDYVFFLPGPGDDRFHVAGAQRDLAIPSSALLVPPPSSLNLDANEEIGLRATESPDCLTLQLCQTNQMWGGESSELLVVKGY